jgi:BlaI family penicillinase repressor
LIWRLLLDEAAIIYVIVMVRNKSFKGQRIRKLRGKKMKELPRISEAEWEIMKIFWDSSPVTANEIIEKLEGRIDWKPKTIKTLISRLLKKNAIAYKKDDRTYRYYPIISKEECIREESQSFLKRVYNGELNVMLTSFLSARPLSEKDIEELKQILDRSKK